MGELELARQGVTDCTDIIIDTFLKRQKHMQSIADAKVAENVDGIVSGKITMDDISVIRLDREMELLKKYADRAEQQGEDPEIVKTLVWHLMYAGKAKQLKILGKNTVFGKEDISPDQLKRNLLDLTRDVCTRYNDYGDGFGATLLARKFGNEYIETIARTIRNKGVAVDLGTANGNAAKLISNTGFKNVIGYDISPDMLRVAQASNTGEGIEYQCIDLFNGIPRQDDSVDFLVANFGSASDVHPDIIKETERVLRKGGKAFLSFYNTDSITSSWWQPIQNGIEVVLNKDSNILEVPIFFDEGPKVYKIYAKSYSALDIKERAGEVGLNIESMGSFSPAFTLTPSEFYRSPERVAVLEKYERSHYNKDPYVGFYITVVLSKESREIPTYIG